LIIRRRLQAQELRRPGKIDSRVQIPDIECELLLETGEVVGLNFSSATTPELMLKTFNQYSEYKRTLVLGK
jgi:hypothetical protein